MKALILLNVINLNRLVPHSGAPKLRLLVFLHMLHMPCTSRRLLFRRASYLTIYASFKMTGMQYSIMFVLSRILFSDGRGGGGRGHWTEEGRGSLGSIYDIHTEIIMYYTYCNFNINSYLEVFMKDIITELVF